MLQELGMQMLERLKGNRRVWSCRSAPEQRPPDDRGLRAEKSESTVL